MAKFLKQTAHHFITESYQRNFTDSKGHVWVLTSEGKIYNTNPLNSFKEDHFYTVKLPTGGGSLIVEKALAEIEGAFVNIVRTKIEKSQFLTDDDRLCVGMFVAAMFTRTKVQRNHFKNSQEMMIEKMEAMKEAMIKNPPKSFPIEHSSSAPSISLEVLKESMQNFDSEESMMTLSLLGDTAPILCSMKWSIITTNEPLFISSDNPLSVCSPEREKIYGRGSMGATAGLIDDDVEITFPLTKNLALFASWKGELPQYVEAWPALVDQINSRTCRTATSIIASSRIQLETIVSKNKKQKES